MKPMHNKEESAARLKEIMTVPAMSAERHAAILRARIGHRRSVEDAREQAYHRRADNYALS
ncbi:MAG: hypothetical protein M3N23_08750 [Pseudomonadota bacterium]|nr:hypothetical protein [Pseudomonadota bacterium]